MKILIVDDTPNNIQIVAQLLSNYDTAFATSGEEAINMCLKDKFDLILLDVMMPGINGFDACDTIKKTSKNNDVPVIFLTAKNDSDSIIKGFECGGQDYITKPFEAKELLARVSTLLKLKDFENKQQEKIDEAVMEQKALYKEIEDTQREVVYTIGAIAETRCKETGGHVARVAEYSYLFANLLGMEEKICKLIKMASPMHDIGKIGIPDVILHKPGKLTDDEWEVMKTHAQLGHDMLKHSKRPILSMASEIAMTHHEKFDGSGYPNGLEGTSIPISGRITALADVFDALGSSRCYKGVWGDKDIFSFIASESGKHFDPVLVDLFFKHNDRFLEIRKSIKD